MERFGLIQKNYLNINPGVIIPGFFVGSAKVRKDFL